MAPGRVYSPALAAAGEGGEARHAVPGWPGLVLACPGYVGPGVRVLDPWVLVMRVLSMRVLRVPVSGVPIRGRRVPGGGLAPGRRLRAAGLPALIVAGSLLVVAAGSPPAGGTSPSPGGPTPPALAM